MLATSGSTANQDPSTLPPIPALRLDTAEKTRTQISQFSLEYPNITIDDAYAIQQPWVALKISAGRRIKGHKIGLTSKAMQYSSNISEPDYGSLLDDMFFYDGAELPFTRFIVPRVEVELAFVLSKPYKVPIAPSSTSSTPPITSSPPSKLSTPASIKSIPKPKSLAKSSTPSPITQPTPHSS